MHANPPVPDDSDPWSIPLHGISVPLPAAGPALDPPPADAPTLDLLTDDVPTDVGYHPRLRRSA